MILYASYFLVFKKTITISDITVFYLPPRRLEPSDIDIIISDTFRLYAAIESNSIVRKMTITLSLRKMFRKDGAFVIFILLFMLFCDETASECTKLTPCSCIFPNGHGFDFSSLSSSGVLEATGFNQTFYFYPCKDVSLPNISNADNHGATEVSLYVHNEKGNFSLGTVKETTIFLPPGLNRQPQLILTHEGRTTVIDTICCNHCTTHLNVDSIVKDKEYNLILSSSDACMVLMNTKGLSTGSVLVILFFTFSGIYFIGGSVALKFLRGATGWEMLPNHKFWCELPSLVRDGISFTFNGCRADSYERI